MSPKVGFEEIILSPPPTHTKRHEGDVSRKRGDTSSEEAFGVLRGQP